MTHQTPDETPDETPGESTEKTAEKTAQKITNRTSEAAAMNDGAQRRRVLQRGLWFEEFETGTIYEHRPGRTVTETDNVLFTTLTMNTQPLHLDAHESGQLPPYHERLVNSMFTLSTLVGLSVAQLTQGTIVANLGFSEVKFPAPVRHGDTLYAETLILHKRPSSSRPGEGVVTMQHIARTQDGTVVAVATRNTLVRMAPQESTDEGSTDQGSTDE